MKPLNSIFLAATTAGILWLGTTHAFAQDDAPPPPPPAAGAGGNPGAGGPGGPGGGGDRQDRMEKFRQQMNERIKTQLKASDDEWAVIQPLLEKVQTKMRETMESRFGGMRGMGGGGPGGPRRGGDNGGGGNTADAARPDANRQRPPGRGPTPEAQELMTTLQNDNASTNDIKTKLQALREQRKKSEAELAQSREDLKKVLTLRQEAIWFRRGCWTNPASASMIRYAPLHACHPERSVTQSKDGPAGGSQRGFRTRAPI